MADLKISQLTAISVLTPATDVLPVVDVGGVTKKITTNQILGSGGTATLASATITGDLTVRTNKLAVTSTGVGFGTTTPTYPFDVVGTGRFVQTNFADNIFRLSTGGSTTGNINQILFADQATTATSAITAYNSAFGSGKNYALGFTTNGSERYLIDSTGVATWFVGGSTAMTLNSTGLGVGVSPDFKFVVNGTQAVPAISGSATDNGSLRIGAPGTGLCIDSGVTAATDVYGWFQARSRTNYATNFNLVFNPNGGNVGIGYIPTAGSLSKVLFIGTGTEPTAGATGAVQYFTSTRSASNTIPAILCEGSGVTNAGITSTTVTNKIAIKVNGTIYYLLATTSAA